MCPELGQTAALLPGALLALWPQHRTRKLVWQRRSCALMRVSTHTAAFCKVLRFCSGVRNAEDLAGSAVPMRLAKSFILSTSLSITMTLAELLQELAGAPPEVLIQPELKQHRQAQDEKIRRVLQQARASAGLHAGTCVRRLREVPFA